MLSKDEREEIAAQVRAVRDPSHCWSFWSLEYADHVTALLDSLDAADKRAAELEAALRGVAALDNVRDSNEPPIPTALRRWKLCVELAREALKETDR